ncbi:hypothetical protein, partial [Desulfovibrio sp.]|uniref:hypothetical protein n=1 Tax=Desulfovibrio sp. TaxID=885 RepID=UPI003AB15FB4
FTRSVSSFMAFFRPPDIHHQGKAGKVFRSSAGRKLIDVWKWDIFTSVCSIFMGASRDQLPVRREGSCFLLASCMLQSCRSFLISFMENKGVLRMFFWPSLPAVADA